MATIETFKIGQFVLSRSTFRYGRIKEIDGDMATVEFYCSVNGCTEMANTDRVNVAYLEDGNTYLNSEIENLENKLEALKQIKRQFTGN